MSIETEVEGTKKLMEQLKPNVLLLDNQAWNIPMGDELKKEFPLSFDKLIEKKNDFEYLQSMTPNPDDADELVNNPDGYHFTHFLKENLEQLVKYNASIAKENDKGILIDEVTQDAFLDKTVVKNWNKINGGEGIFIQPGLTMNEMLSAMLDGEVKDMSSDKLINQA